MSISTFNMENPLFLAFANKIDEFYREKFNYKTSCAFPRFPTIDINRSAVRLYLRFKPKGSWPNDSIVIASIEFQKQRRGHGKALLQKLVDMSARYEFRSIGIEQTSSKEGIQNFVRKFGFKNHGNERNWLVSIDTLKLLLDATSPKH